MKRIVSLTLALLLVLSLFAACGGGVKPTEAPPATEAPAEKPTDAPDAPDGAESPSEGVSYPLTEEYVEFDVFMAMAGFIPMILGDGTFNDMPAVQIMEEQTGVHLNFAPIDQDAYATKINIMFASGEYPDYIGAADESYVGGIDALIGDDVCIDLASLLDSCLPDFKKIYDDPQYEHYSKDITSDTGKIATIYTIEEQSGMGSVIRQDWLEELNMDVPDTYDDLYDVLTGFKTELGAKYPMLLCQDWTINSNNEFVGGFGTAGGPGVQLADLRYHIEDGTVVASVASDSYKAYIEMINKWYAEGLIGEASTTIANPMQYQEYITRNETGFWAGQSDTMGESVKEQAGGSFNAQPIEPITLEPGDTFRLYANGATKGPGGWAISTQCEDPEMAAKVINWFWTDEGFEACNYGVEGVTFNYTDDGGVEYTDVILNNPNGFNAFFNSCKEIIFFDFPFLFSVERKLATTSNQAEVDSQTVWKQNRDNSMEYVGDLSIEESDIYTKIIGDLNTYALENIGKFVVGEKSMDEWDSFVEDLNDFGLEEAVSLKQAAYERYQQR